MTGEQGREEETPEDAESAEDLGAAQAPPRAPIAAAPAAEWRALASALPRKLIAEGVGETLARRWLAARDEAIRAGLPPMARWPLDRSLQAALFDARRARRLVRGLEGAEQALAAEQRGLERLRKGAPRSGRRISRLLVVTADGSDRFYRQVGRLRDKYANRLEVMVVDGDEEALGGAVYGRGRRARAVLVSHKEPVARLLALLARSDAPKASGADA